MSLSLSKGSAERCPSITSIYRWRGEVHRDSEVLLVAKSRLESFESLAARVKALHSYEVLP